MIITNMINRPCTWVQRAAETYDQFGDPVVVETLIATFCELQTITRATFYIETSDGSVGINTYKLFLPPDVLPDNRDAILIDGDTYEFTGDPVTRRDPVLGNDVFTEGWVRRID